MHRLSRQEGEILCVDCFARLIVVLAGLGAVQQARRNQHVHQQSRGPDIATRDKRDGKGRRPGVAGGSSAAGGAQDHGCQSGDLEAYMRQISALS